MEPLRNAFWLGAVTLAAAACSGGTIVDDPCAPPQSPTDHVVDISWAPSRERGVNEAGGGYRVEISGRTPVVLPFDPDIAPTPLTTTLRSGCYTVKVRAYAALDPQGTTTGAGTLSAPATLSIKVP